MTEVHTGGCQCGAVRFRIEGELADASICHCRMCQKAFGNFYAPLVSVRGATLTWTRGAPKTYRSSNFVERGFCGECGTPLSYDAPDGIAIAVGAFDHPADIEPKLQWGIEAKIPYVDAVASLPAHSTTEDSEAAPFLRELISYQHPDHDTEHWPER